MVYSILPEARTCVYVDARKHIPHELRASTEGSQDRHAQDRLPVNRIKRTPRHRIKAPHISTALPIHLCHIVVDEPQDKNADEEPWASDIGDSDDGDDHGHEIHHEVSDVISELRVDALEIFSKAIEEASTGDGVVEPDLGEKDRLEEALIENS